MPQSPLTPRDHLILFTLSALDLDVATNADLKAAAGFTIDKPNRDRLTSWKLLEATMVSRSYRYELTDAGWAWCADALAAGPPARSDAGTRVLYLQLNRLGRYLAASGLKFGELGQVRATVEEQLLDAYRVLAPTAGEWVPLRDLRMRVPRVPRTELDEALLALLDRPDVNLAPDSDQAGLKKADRDAALHVGGKANHLISIKEI